MKILLASGSPRRSFLLKQAGLTFKKAIPRVEEIAKKRESPKDFVRRLAREKGTSFLTKLMNSKSSIIVISADTIVVDQRKGKILGKPKDRKQALNMLSSLSGKEHLVHTGYFIYSVRNGKMEKRVSRVVTTRVTFAKLSRKEMSSYIRKGESMDKAGAYAAQGFGMNLILKINGSYTNVVGLPMAHLMKDLDQTFGLKCFQ